jgi:hypothetical protein
MADDLRRQPDWFYRARFVATENVEKFSRPGLNHS